MSYWSDIYAGDARSIAQAFNESEPIEGQPFVAAQVNLPGIIPDDSEEVPNSPNLLTELVCKTVGHGPLTFSGSISEHLGGDPDPSEATSGAYAMGSKWV